MRMTKIKTALVVAAVGGLAAGGPACPAQAAPARAETAGAVAVAGTAAARPPMHGDLTGDGRADLAVYGGFHDGGEEFQLVPGAPVGTLGRGAVAVNQHDPGIPLKDDPAWPEAWGQVLAYGDFNGDGRTDLAVGAPTAGVGGATWAGAVGVLYGRATAPYYTRARVFTQDTPGIPDRAEEDDHFGSALASGDFDGDGYADLAVGTPRESFGSEQDAGSVTLLRGTRGGLTATGARLLTQNSPGIPGTLGFGHRFGHRLATGNLAGTRADELVVVTPFDPPPAGTRATSCTSPAGPLRSRPRGSLTVLRGSTSGGPTAGGAQYFTAAGLGTGDLDVGANAPAGTVAVTGRLYGGGYADLAVAATGANGGPCGEGVVAVLRGGTTGLATAARVLTAGHAGRARQAGAAFGRDLAAGDIDGNGTDDLLVTTPAGAYGQIADHGYTAALLGSTRGPATAGRFTWAAVKHLNSRPAAGALLDVDGDRRPEAVVLAPDATTLTEPEVGFVYVLKLRKAGGSLAVTALQTLSKKTLGPAAGHNGPVGPLAH
ncbi:hypothetical protein [Streptomyces sp. NPDC093225]|uniref:hypothetical protein n=1 Tax=Streptomyces sp. NPDC093225 TaxID=3366034 RepID=UPI003827671F